MDATPMQPLGSSESGIVKRHFSGRSTRVSMTTGSDSDGGFVTLALLLALATVAALLTATMSETRMSGSTLVALEKQTLVEVENRAAIRRTFAAMEYPLGEKETGTITVPGTTLIQINGIEIVVALENEAGKINPFSAHPTLLEAYISSVTGRPLALSTISNAYSLYAQGETIAALTAIKATLLGYLTVDEIDEDLTLGHTSEGVDPVFANHRVLNAVPGMTGHIEEILANRRESPSSVRALSPYFTSDQAGFRAVTSRSQEGFGSLSVTFDATSSGKIRTSSGFLYP